MPQELERDSAQPSDRLHSASAAHTSVPPYGFLRRHLGRFVPDRVWNNWCWDALAGVFSGIYQGAIWTFALQLARDRLHASGFQMGLATAAPAIGYLFATLWARQMEGRSKLPFVTITWLISRGLFVLTPLLLRGSHRTELFVSLICITPILFSVSTPAYTAIMKDIYPDEHRGRLMSMVRIGMAAAMLITAKLMGWWQEHGGLDYAWMFAIGGVFGIGTAFAFSRLRLPSTLHANTPPPPLLKFLGQTFSILVHNRGYRWFTTSVFITGFGNLVATTYYPIYQVDRFHITPTQIATMATGLNIASLISLFFWGWFLDRFGSLSTVLVAVVINCFTPVLYALAPNLLWIYLAAVTIGFMQSGIDLGYLNTTLMFAEPGRTAHYQAVHSTFFGLRGTIAPLLAIRLLHLLGYNFRTAFLVCTVIILVGVLFQMLSLRSYRRNQIQSKRAG